MRELDANEIEALIECVDAVLLESVVPDWEFHTLIGFEKSKIREMFSDSDDFIDMNHERVMAISNIASAVLFYPHEIHDEWSKYFSFSRNLLNIINKKIQNNIN